MKKAGLLFLAGLLLLAMPVFAQATSTINYGETVIGTISDAAESEVWEFNGAAGDVVTITMIADASGSLDPRLFLYDEDSYLLGDVALAENDDSGDVEIGSLNSRIEDFELPVDGLYFIEASRFSGEGGYTLSLESGAMNTGGEELRQWASSATGTSQYGEENWSFSQATGEPNTAECGDYTTAWASSSSTGSDMLALEFETPVRATEVNIYETYNPGSIIRVELTNTISGEIFEIPDSADPLGNTPCPGTFTLSVPEIDMLANGVIIYLDQTIGGSWNEIDAVELVGIVPGEAPEVVESMDGVQTVALDGGESDITLSVPADWVTDYDGTFTLAGSSESVMQVFRSSDIVPAPSGELVIAVVSPTSLAQIAGEVSEQTTTAYLETAMGAMSFTGEVIDYDGFAVPASFVVLDESPDVPPNAVMFMLELDEGFAWVIVVTGGDPVDFEPEIVEIVNTLAGVEPSFTAVSGDVAPVEPVALGALSTLSEVFDNGSVLEIDAPADFVSSVDNEGYVYVANTEEVLSALNAGNTQALPDGSIGITVALPGTLDEPLGLADGATARQALEAFVTAISSTGAVEDYRLLNDTAAFAEMQGELAPPNAVVITTDNENGVFFFAIQFGPDMTFASVEDTIIEMINSLNYIPN